MKLRRFNVFYRITTSYDADVFAKNKKEAIAKVVEVVGPVQIKGVNELPVEVLTSESNTTTIGSTKGVTYYYTGTKNCACRNSDRAGWMRSKKGCSKK